MTQKNTTSADHKLLSPKEAATQLGVAPVTIRLWAQENKLPFTTTPGGHRRFKQQDINEFIVHNMNPQSTGLTVLIVDDNEAHAEYLFEFIRRMDKDINTSIALDGFEAGQLIYEIKPDLILLDLVMSGIDGYAVCKRIKSNPTTEKIRVVAMTGYSTPENINKVLKAGAETCLLKPIDTKILTKTLQQSIDKHENKT